MGCASGSADPDLRALLMGVRCEWSGWRLFLIRTLWKWHWRRASWAHRKRQSTIGGCKRRDREMRATLPLPTAKCAVSEGGVCVWVHVFRAALFLWSDDYLFCSVSPLSDSPRRPSVERYRVFAQTLQKIETRAVPTKPSRESRAPLAQPPVETTSLPCPLACLSIPLPHGRRSVSQ